MKSIDTARAAPTLTLPILESPQAHGHILEVARVAIADDLAWVETTDGHVLRLPESLHDWAKTAVAVAVSMANPFPSKAEFGIVAGRAYAQIL